MEHLGPPFIGVNSRRLFRDKLMAFTKIIRYDLTSINVCDSPKRDADGSPLYLQWTNTLVLQREEGVKARLFCLPFAGGGASVFREWPKKLPRTVQVIALQLPGREGRWNEPPCQAMSDIVDQLVVSLRPILDRPFGIFGHSMGAML